MKRTFNLAVFLVICLSLLLSGNSAARGLQGDADGNGRVNIFDALILAELSVGLRTQDQVPGYADADVDANGKVDIDDALMIARYDVGLISGFASKVYDGTETRFSLIRGGANQFLLPVEIGNQTFNLLVDTGSDALLVFEDKLDASNISVKRSKSPISVTDTKISKSYSSGTRSGVLATADVRIGAFSASQMKIMVIRDPDSQDDPSLTPKGADGIIGLRRTGGLNFSSRAGSLDAPLNVLIPGVGAMEFDFPPSGEAVLSFGNMPNLERADTRFVFRGKALSVAAPSDMTGQKNFSDLQVPFRAKSRAGEANGEDLDILLDTGAVSRLVLDTEVAEKLGYNPDSGKWEIGDGEEIELNLIGENDTVTLYPKFKVWEVSVAPYRMMGVEFEAVLGISRWQEYIVGFDYVPHHNGGPDGTISLLRRLDMNDALSDEPPALSEAFVGLPGLNSVGNDESPAADDTGDTVVFHSDREGGTGGKDIYVWKKGQGILDLPGLNSAGEDANPGITGDGGYIVFQSDRDGSSDIFLYDLDQKTFAELPGLNSPEADDMPGISRDGGYIAFASRRSGAGGSDVYLYDRQNSRFADLPGLNTEADELSPFISENGRQLAFTAMTGDPAAGQPAGDVRLYDVQEQGMISLSKGMRGVNTGFNEQNPVITADSDRMAFHTNRRNPEMGLFDRDILLVDMAMQIPVQQPGLNSDFDEISPRFTGNGEMIVFQSRRPGGEGGSDIYMYRMGQTAAAVPGEQRESVALTRTSDGLFTAPVNVGGKNLNLAVDPAFSGLLIFRDAVSGLSLTETGEPATLRLGAGQVAGTIATTDVSVSGRSAEDMQIIIADRENGSTELAEVLQGFENLEGVADGIFGLYISVPLPFFPDSPMMTLKPAFNLLELNLDPEGTAGMSLGTMPLAGGVSEHLSWHTNVPGQMNPHNPADSFTNMAVPFIAAGYAAGSDTPAAYFGKAESYQDGQPVSRAVPGALIRDRIIIDTGVAEELGYDSAASAWGETNRVSISLLMYGSDALLPVAREIPTAKTDVADLSGETYSAVLGSDYWNSYILGFDTADYQNDGPAGMLFMVRRQDALASDALAGTDHHFTELPGLNSIADDMLGDVSDDGKTLVFQSSRADGAGETDIYVYRIGEGILELPGMNGPGYDREPSLNGDGSLVAFDSNRNGSSDIFLYDIATQSFIELPGLNTDNHENAPDISSDGTRLICHSLDPGDSGAVPELKIYDIENKTALRTPSNMRSGLADSGPSLNGDGRLVAFARKSAGDDKNLRIYDGRRGRMRQLPEHLNTPFMENGWNLSSDGNFIAFSSNRNDPDDGHTGKDILLAELASEEFLFLPSLNSGFEDGGPALSQNAEYVVFHSKRPGGEGGYDIYLYQRDTEDDTPYTVTAEYTEDGYVQGGSRMIADAEVRATDGDGNVIASAVTGADGHFTMTVPAGVILPVRYETGVSNAKVVVDEVGDDTYVPDFEAGNLKFTDVWVEDTMQSGFAAKIWFDVETETPKYNTFVKLYLVNLPTGSVDDLDISGANFRPDYSLTGLFIENLGHAGSGDPVTDTQDADTVTKITYLTADNTTAHVEHSFRIPPQVADGTYAAVFSIGRFDYHAEDDALQSEDSADKKDNYMVAPASVIIGQPDKPNLRILSAELNTNSLVLPNNPPAGTSAPAQSDLSLNMEVESMSQDTEEAVDIVFGLEIDGSTYPLSIGASKGGRKIVKTDKKTYEVQCRDEDSRCASLFRQEQQGHTYKLYLSAEAYDALASKPSDTLCNLVVTVDPDGNVEEWEDNKADNVKEMPVMFLAASQKRRRSDTTECSNTNLDNYGYGYECNFFENNVGISNPSGGEEYGNSIFNVGYSFGCDMSYEMDDGGEYPTAAQFDALSDANANEIYVTVFGTEIELLGIGVGFDVNANDITSSYFGYKAYVLGLSEWSSISEFIQNSAYDGEVTEDAIGNETYSGSIDVNDLLSLEAGTTYYSFCSDPESGCSDFSEAEIWNTQDDDGNEKYSLSKSYEKEKTFTVAGIPITVAGGVTGELGVRGSISVAANNKLILAAGPYAAVTGFAEGSVGVSGIQAGVGINLLILEVSLDLTPSIQILPSIGAAIFEFETPFTISTLDGDFYAFAIMEFNFLGVHVELEYTYTILEWEGLSWQVDLFDPYSKTWMEADAYLTKYYSGTGLSGDPTTTTSEDIIYHDWGSDNPVDSDDDFSVSWDGYFNLDEGDYTFKAETDSSIRVNLDGDSLFDSWQTEGALTDFTGNGYDGTFKNDTTQLDTDAISTASQPGSISFDGSNDYVDINGDVIDLASSFTLEAWIKTTGTRVGILAKRDDDSTWESGDKVFCIFDSGQIIFEGWGSGRIEGEAVVNDGQWHHIAVVWDSSNHSAGKIYVDGDDDTLTSGYNGGNADNSGDTIKIGSYFAENNFNGEMDEIRIWDDVRIEEGTNGINEISDNMNVQLTGTEDNLVAYYRMDGSSFSSDMSIDSDSLLQIQVDYKNESGDAEAKFYWLEDNAFTGFYFNNENLTGDPAWFNTDDEIDFQWGESSPKPDTVNEDSFSVRWEGVFDFEAETFAFLIESDDSSVSLSVDGTDISLSETGTDTGIYYGTHIISTADSYDIEVEYHHSSGDAYIDVDLQPVDKWLRNDYIFSGSQASDKVYSTHLVDQADFNDSEEVCADYPDCSFCASLCYNWLQSYKGVFYFDEGDYDFIARAAYGMKVYIDGYEYLGAWELDSAKTFIFSAYMSGGYHYIEVEYFKGDMNDDEYLWVRELDWYQKQDNEFTACYYRTYDDMEEDDSWDSDSYNENEINPLYIRKENEEQTDDDNYCFWTSLSITCDWETSSPTYSLQPIDDDLDSLNNDGTDNFGVRWEGDFDFTEGVYLFTAAVNEDDGIRVWVDNVSRIDEINSAGDSSCEDSTATCGTASDIYYHEALTMTGDTHQIRMEYGECTCDANVDLNWQSVTEDTFYARYFDSSDLSGTPLDGGSASSIDENWGSGGPATNTDGFSARWVGVFDFYEAEYDFTVTTDGGVIVYVDGNSVISEWSAANTPTTYTATTVMSAGYHSVKVEYYHDTGSNAQISLSMEPWTDLAGYALSFDGSDDYVELPADTWFSSDFTIESWVYVNSYNKWSRLIDFGNGSSSDNVLVALSNNTTGKPRLGIFQGSTETTVDSPDALPLNQWTHIAVTLEGTTGTMYINGVQVAENTSMNIPNDVIRENAYIGRSNWDSDAYADAMFDELRIWNTARSETEIQTYMYKTLIGTEASLAAYYTFDQDTGTILTDSAGTYDGTLHNSPTWETSGVVLNGMSAPGNALEFDGTDDYVSLGVPDSLKLSIFTISTWFKRNGSGENTDTGSGGVMAEPLVTKGRGEEDDSNLDMNYFLGISSSGYLVADFEDSTSGGNHPLTGVSAIADNEWNHAAVTFDGSSLKLYLNGALENESTPGALPRSDSIQHNAIGTALNSSGIPEGYFNGEIDEVRIWSTARSESEIMAYMNRPLTGYENELAAYYQFDKVSGTTLPDFTGGNDGTLYNSPSWVTSGATLSEYSQPGNALEFDGTDDYLELPTDAVPLSKGTIEYWVQHDSVSDPGILVYTGNASDQNGLGGGDILEVHTGIDNGKVVFIYQDGTASIRAESSDISAGEWVHVAVTYDTEDSAKIYINGQLSSTAVDMSSVSFSGYTSTFSRIGRPGSDSRYFSGQIDELRIWSTVRTDDEIQDNMYSTVLDTESYLEAYYRFDQSDGTELIDLTANDRDGTINGNPTWESSSIYGTDTELTTPGNALEFDGIDDYITLPADTWFNGDFTVEAWIYMNSYQYWSKLINIGSSSSADTILISPSKGTTGKPVCQIYLDGSGQTNLVSSDTIPLNQWTHLAVTLEGNTGTIYINGVLVGQNTSMYIPADVIRDRAYFGGNPALNRMSDAVFDELRIWSTARSQAEIQTYMNTTVPDTESYLEAYYRFDQTDGTELIDLTANDHDGTINGAPAWTTSEAFSVDPQPGYALEFDGSDDYLELPADAVPLSKGTIEYWVRHDSVIDPGILVYTGNASDQNGFGGGDILEVHTAIDNGKVVFVYQDGTAKIRAESSDITAGQWVHVAVSYDTADSARIYINGQPSSTAVDMSSVSFSGYTSTFSRIGRPGSNSRYFQGLIDELRIWSTVRTEDEIQTYMNTTVSPDESNLEAYYRFDQSSGTEVTDLTDYDNDGTLNGNPTWTTSGADIE